MKKVSWREISAKSTLDVSLKSLDDGPRYLISIKGPAANIPSLKNGKLPGRNFINNNVKQHLQALTWLFNCNYNKYGHFPTFGDTNVFMMVVLGNKSKLIDDDNCLAAVRDWLEPPTKSGIDRGWGIGLVNSDRYVTGAAVSYRVVRGEEGRTLIGLCPLSLYSGRLTNFVHDFFYGMGCKATL